MFFWICFLSGVFVLICGLLAVLKEVRLCLFGSRAKGTIVGYGSERRYRYNIIHTYKVEYEYQGKKYEAISLETKNTYDFSVFKEKIVPPPKCREVTVCFDEGKPESVSIMEFAFRNGLVCFICAIIGAFLIIVSLMSKGII